MNPLPIDLDDLLTAQAYAREGRSQVTSTFEVQARSYPLHWSFYVSAGAGDIVRQVARLGFEEDAIAFLKATRRFDDEFLETLSRWSFAGDIWGIPEGEVFFATEPVIQVTASLCEAQIVGSLVLSTLQHHCLAATRAARCVLVAGRRTLLDLSVRACPGDAGLAIARASYLAGFSATSNLGAAIAHGIPTAGMVRDSHVMAHESELEAQRAHVHQEPDCAILPVDTYDPHEGVRTAVRVGLELRAQGRELHGIRLDNSHAADHLHSIRRMLDEAGLTSTQVILDGDIDESVIEWHTRGSAQVQGFGVGSALLPGLAVTEPSFTYDLVQCDSRPVLRRWRRDLTLPMRKQVYRVGDAQARPRHDLVTDFDDPMDGFGPKAWPVLKPLMRDGRPVGEINWDVQDARDRCAASLRLLRQDVARIRNPANYQVRTTPRLEKALDHLG